MANVAVPGTTGFPKLRYIVNIILSYTLFLTMSESANSAENLLPYRGEVIYSRGFFEPDEARRLMDSLLSEVPWKQEPIKMFGKEVMQPRLTAWYGDPGKEYKYSGVAMQPLAWHPALMEIKTRIEMVSKTRFTGALLNYYRDGNDSMGWHRDNEKSLGINPVIGSVSFGETRKFQLRDYATKTPTIGILLEHGSFLLMRGETQHFWEHRVPKSTMNSPRLNITFRVL